MRNTLDTVVELYEKQASEGVLETLGERGFELIYDEATGFSYDKPSLPQDSSACCATGLQEKTNN